MKYIKIYLFLFTVLIFGATSSFAQRPENFTKIVTENLVNSLNHKVEGVVEASIYNSLFLTKYYPDAKIDEVLDELNDIASHSKNPVLRYKAQLAVLYITNYPNSDLNVEDYKQNQTELFKTISKKLTNTLLVANQTK